jgi:DNA-binding transcriptional ArsR family regulator
MRFGMAMPDDPLSLVFAALADPTRRAILTRLAQGEATVAELTKPFSISQPAISRHLKVLERAGLIARDKTGRFRPSALRVQGLDEARNWIAYWRGVWDERFARLDAHLARIGAAGAATTTTTGKASR